MFMEENHDLIRKAIAMAKKSGLLISDYHSLWMISRTSFKVQENPSSPMYKFQLRYDRTDRTSHGFKLIVSIEHDLGSIEE